MGFSTHPKIRPDSFAFSVTAAGGALYTRSCLIDVHVFFALSLILISISCENFYELTCLKPVFTSLLKSKTSLI